MKILTKSSVKNYQKLLKNIIDIPLFEMFLEIGVELIELYPQEQYIHILIEEMQEQHVLDNIEELNMKLRQVQDFYNDVIATYENDSMFEGSMDEPLAIEDSVMHMMSYQNAEHNYGILRSILIEAVEVVADEYGFLDALEDMKDAELRKYLKKEVFLGTEVLYTNFVSLLDLRNTMLSDKKHDNDALYVTAILITINFSMFNMIRKERFMLEQDRDKVKIGRNDPCPCGSGKKYKKCCLKDIND